MIFIINKKLKKCFSTECLFNSNIHSILTLFISIAFLLIKFAFSNIDSDLISITIQCITKAFYESPSQTKLILILRISDHNHESYQFFVLLRYLILSHITSYLFITSIFFPSQGINVRHLL